MTYEREGHGFEFYHRQSLLSMATVSLHNQNYYPVAVLQIKKIKRLLSLLIGTRSTFDQSSVHLILSAVPEVVRWRNQQADLLNSSWCDWSTTKIDCLFDILTNC